MKKFALLCLLIISCNFGITNAQTPQSMAYQAVARDSSGNTISNQTVGLRFTIRDASASGTIVYRETQSAVTNLLGLFTVSIGQGSPVIGTFSSINWATGAKYIQVELDPAGGTTYLDMGTQQMMSVPYALYAESANVPGVPGPQGPSGAGYYATSVSTHSISLGSKTFITQADLAYVPNQRVRLSPGFLNYYVEGTVTSYSATSLIVNVDNIVGAGSYSNWVIGVSGEKGAAGSTGAQGPAGATGPAGPAPSGTGIVTVNGGVLNTPAALNGDVFTTGGSLTATLSPTGVVTGTYTKLTVDTKGRVTSATTLTPADIPSLSANYVDLSSIQSINGAKTFNSPVTFAQDVFINNLRVGRGAGSFATNSIVGENAFASNTLGGNNSVVGYQALPSNSNGTGNTTIGYQSMFSNVSGGYNTAIGASALYHNSSGSNNTALGALTTVSSGNLTNATVIGYGATVDASNKIQLGNTSVTAVNTSGILSAAGFIKSGGLSSQYLMADGSVSTLSTLPPSGAAGGDLAGSYPNPVLAGSGVTAGTYGNATAFPIVTVDSKGRLTAASLQSLPTTLPPSGAAGGDLSGTYPNPSLVNSGVTAGTYPKVTVDAKGRVTSGAGLSFSDIPSLSSAYVDLSTSQTVAGNKTFSGTTGFNQDVTISGIKIGMGAGSQTQNTIIGNSSFTSNTTGNYNTSLGYYTLVFNASASYNTAIGSYSLSNATGSFNTAVGYSAFNGVIAGTGNTAIGANTSVANGTISNSTAIGRNATVNQSNTIQLGDGSVTSVNTSAVVTANGFIKSGGLASQFLMANGSTLNTTMGGDLSGTFPNPVLTTTGVTAGTYPKVTVDTKGRVTSGASLVAGDIPNLSSSYVDLTTSQSVGGNKTFSGTVQASAIVKTGGTSSQYLMADGSTSTAAAIMPVGSIQMYAASTAPNASWMICNGAAISRTTYAALFALIGTTYGAGDGSTTFNLPNMTGKFPLGVSAAAPVHALGSAGGDETHTLTVNELAPHTHGAGSLTTTFAYKSSTNTGNQSAKDGADANLYNSNAITGSTASAGSGTPFSVMPPYITLNFIIRVQ